MKPHAIPTFRSTAPSSFRHATAGRLAEWLERYVNALFPDNGAESWYVPRRSGEDAFLGKDDRLPERIHHVACYVSQGSNEGHYIYISLSSGSGETRRVATVKSFGGGDECWSIARLCSEALTAVFWFGEQPQFVEFWLKLPRDQSWHRHTTLTGEVRLRRIGPDLAQVLDSVGSEIDAHRFPGGNAALAREAYLADWATLLSAQGLSVRDEPAEDPQ